MANPNSPRDPLEPTDPRHIRGDQPAFLPTWGWVAIVMAAIVVFSLIFTWGDSTQQQQAEFQTNQPPATSSAPPPSSPGAPPARSPAPKQ